MPKSSPDGGHPVGCDDCGRFIDKVFAPDSQYTFLISEPCKEGDSKKITLKCANCGKENVRYWDRFHTYVAVA